MKYLNVFRLVVITLISLGILSTSYAASTPIKRWPIDLCAVAKVSIDHLPKPTHCSRIIAVRTKEIGDTLVITFQTRQPAVIQLTRAKFYNHIGELVRDVPYYYPAVIPKPQDYKTRQTSKLTFASDDEVKVIFSISVRWLYRGGVEHRTYPYNRQTVKPSQPFMPTSLTLNPGPISHQTIPEELKPEPALSSLNERSQSAVNHDQPTQVELVQVIPNIHESTAHTNPVVESIVEPISHEVRPPAHGNPDQSSSLAVTDELTNGLAHGVQPVAPSESGLVQVSPIVYPSLTPPLNPPPIDDLPDRRHDLKPAEPKTPKTIIGHPAHHEMAPRVISISPKRVGNQIFAHVKTDQPAAIILSAMSRCQGEACFGWQASIAPPTDSSQLVTELDLLLLEVSVLPVPSEIRFTITTIDLAKRTATFNYRYDPATNTLTPE